MQRAVAKFAVWEKSFSERSRELVFPLGRKSEAEGKKDLTHGFCIKPGEGCSGMNGR